MSLRSLAAYGVHLFTASGIAFGFLALIAVIQGDRLMAFVFLGVALIIDGIDGPLARAVKVQQQTPQIDGQSLDYVIDYVTYALIPALMVWQWNLVPDGWGLTAGIAIAMASAFTFANVNMKTADGYFLGFPAIWNLVVFYLVILGLGPWVSFVIIGLCLILTFIPTAYAHPFRVRQIPFLKIGATLVWIIAAGVLVYEVLMMEQTAADVPIFTGLFTLSSLYFFGISLWRSLN